ncbi:MAG: prepilin-type N-terminal cleavage/methylation domain-containing protein [Vulcanimicrobiota bacterium]
MKRAFTLLEVLLATLLFGLLSAMLYGLMVQGLQRSRALASETVRQHQGQVLQAMLHNDLLTSAPEGCLIQSDCLAVIPLSQVDAGGEVHWANYLLLYLLANKTLQRHEVRTDKVDLSGLGLGQAQPPKLTPSSLQPIKDAVRDWRSGHHWNDVEAWKLETESRDGALNYRLQATFQYGTQQDVLDVLLW